MEAFGVIYLLVDGTNDLEYVGQTTQKLERRIKEHKHGDQYIDRAIRKYGWENFTVEVLKVCGSKEELDFWEKHFIKARDTKRPNGYNLTDGGEGIIGLERTPEHCKNISESKKGEKHPFYGKHHTPEHRANIAAGLRGVKKTAEHCAHLSESKMGTHIEDETRDKMAESRSGERNPNSGKPRPPEVAFQISSKNRSESPYKNLVAEMDARQMSVAALAKFLGINSATLSGKMRGKINFTSEQIAKIAELLQKPAAYLFERDENFSFEPATDRRKSPYKNLIAELDARGFSFPKVAELIGSSKSSIYKKMRGERNFKDSEKKKLAEILGKPIEYLLIRSE